MPPRQAFILSLGNELVLGHTVDTNSNWLCRELAALGWDVIGVATFGDRTADIARAFGEAAARADAVLATGGLGPTEDDRTRHALAEALGEKLTEHPELVEQIAARFRRIGRPMTPINRVQAQLPESASGLANPCGTAPGIRCRLGGAEVFCMPGVPGEMREMFRVHVAPWLEERAAGAARETRLLHAFGVGESVLGEQIRRFMVEGANPEVGTAVSEGVVTVRVSALAESRERVRGLVEPVAAEIASLLGADIFGRDGETLAEAAVKLLLERQATLALAESCTGGLIASMLVDVPGVSGALLESCVTYSNEAKAKRLGVPPALLEQHGAVSAEVARAMAEGSRISSGADYALAATGVAGPGGGTPEKPVGTVWIALADQAGSCYTCRTFASDRRGNRLRAAQTALDLLRRRIAGAPLPGEVTVVGR